MRFVPVSQFMQNQHPWQIRRCLALRIGQSKYMIALFTVHKTTKALHGNIISAEKDAMHTIEFFIAA